MLEKLKITNTTEKGPIYMLMVINMLVTSEMVFNMVTGFLILLTVIDTKVVLKMDFSMDMVRQNFHMENNMKETILKIYPTALVHKYLKWVISTLATLNLEIERVMAPIHFQMAIYMKESLRTIYLTVEGYSQKKMVTKKKGFLKIISL